MYGVEGGKVPGSHCWVYISTKKKFYRPVSKQGRMLEFVGVGSSAFDNNNNNDNDECSSFRPSRFQLCSLKGAGRERSFGTFDFLGWYQLTKILCSKCTPRLASPWWLPVGHITDDFHPGHKIFLFSIFCCGWVVFILVFSAIGTLDVCLVENFPSVVQQHDWRKGAGSWWMEDTRICRTVWIAVFIFTVWNWCAVGKSRRTHLHGKGIEWLSRWKFCETKHSSTQVMPTHQLTLRHCNCSQRIFDAWSRHFYFRYSSSRAFCTFILPNVDAAKYSCLCKCTFTADLSFCVW